MAREEWVSEIRAHGSTSMSPCGLSKRPLRFESRWGRHSVSPLQKVQGQLNGRDPLVTD